MSPGICGWSADTSILGEIFQVDGREGLGADGVELDFVAGGDAEQADLARGVVHGNQPDGMLEGQRPGGNLRADEQREGTRLRRVERHAQLARVGVEAPQARRWKPVASFAALSAAAGLPESITSVMVVPAGTSRTNSLSSPCAGRMET